MRVANPCSLLSMVLAMGACSAFIYLSLVTPFNSSIYHNMEHNYIIAIIAAVVDALHRKFGTDHEMISRTVACLQFVGLHIVCKHCSELLT